ncbi:MAG: hypothetical protein E7588_00090 [Ruminococcaceae bacterium]|nr:hypothetical protein [Oscillospiraceae bacterium]
MIGKAYSAIIIAAVIFSALNGKLGELSGECIKGAVNAVKFMLELGAMTGFWCGIMNVFEKCGLLDIFARIIRPVLKVFFPDASKKNAAMQEISVNVCANFLGLGNAATPAGITAMKKMKEAGVHTNDMVMLSVLNTASLQLIPTTLISLRTMANSQNAYEIMPPVWICSAATVAFALAITKGLSAFSKEGKR